MILSDVELKAMIGSKQMLIEPVREGTIQQNGVDFRLKDELAVGTPKHTGAIIDGSSTDSIRSFFQILKALDGCFVLEPLKNYLLTTEEYIKMPNHLMGLCGLRSTFARLGFTCPLTIVDAGFEGTLTIGVFYGGSAPIKIPVGCRFLHVVFAKLLTEVDVPYQGHYKNQKGVSLPKSIV